MIFKFPSKGLIRYESKEYTSFHLIVPVSKFPKGIPNKINARGNEDNNKYVKSMVNTLEGPYSERFEAFNRGVTIIANSVSYDPENSTLVVDISDGEKYGIADGGHTVAAIEKAHNSNADVRVEIVVATKRSLIRDITIFRNNGKNVKAEDLANLSGDFDIVKAIMQVGGLPTDNTHIAERSGDFGTKHLTKLLEPARIVATFTEKHLVNYRKGVFDKAYKGIASLTVSPSNVIKALDVETDKYLKNVGNFPVIAAGIHLYQLIDQTINCLPMEEARALLGITEDSSAKTSKRLDFLADASADRTEHLSYLYTFLVFHAFRAFLAKGKDNQLRWAVPDGDIVEFFEGNSKKAFEIVAKELKEAVENGLKVDGDQLNHKGDIHENVYSAFVDWRDERDEEVALGVA